MKVGLTERKRRTPPETFRPCRLEIPQVREVREGGHPVASHYIVHLHSHPCLNSGEEQHGVDKDHDGRCALDILRKGKRGSKRRAPLTVSIPADGPSAQV